MRRLLTLLLLVLPLVPARAEALTVRDVVELTRAGLGDDVLLALIEVDRTVFSIDTATLKSLKESGVSEKVILAMIRSGRTQPPPVPEPVVVNDPPPPQDPPQVIVIDHREPEVREILVGVPVYVPVFPSRRGRHAVPVVPSFQTPYPSFQTPYIQPSGTRFIPATGLSGYPRSANADIFSRPLSTTVAPKPNPPGPDPKK
jgi:hypothetical protein